MVQTKKTVLEVEEIDVLVDIVQDVSRIKAVEDGLGPEYFKGHVRPGSLVPDKDRLQDQITA
jgi:hypothetical protein